MVKKNLKTVFILIIAIVIIGYFGAAFYVSDQMTHETERHIDISPIFISNNYENISFKDSDSLTLRGWFFRAQSDRLILLVQGVLSNRVNTAYYGSIIARELLAKNYNILVFDHRATGLSDGNRASYGQHEAGGVTAAVNWAKQKGFAARKIGIIADSMGTAATLGAIKSINDIGPIVLDSTPANMEIVASHILTSERGVPPWLLPAVFLINRTIYNVDISQVIPIDRVKEVPERTFLLLSGAKDTSISPANSQEILTVSNPQSRLVIFPEGSHIETYKTDPNLYRQEVFGFLDNGFK